MRGAHRESNMRRFNLIVTVCVLASAALAARKIYREPGLQEGRTGMNHWNDALPGSTVPLARNYHGAAPSVPHGIEGLSITRDANDCLGCHLDGTDFGDGHIATKAPSSHFSNPYTKETRTDTVIGMRYNCLQCHATVARDAAPPVGQR